MTDQRRRLIAITGGIGSGKSIVSRVVSAMGFPVYDCDSRARLLMDTDPAIIASIATRIHPTCVTPAGTLDRARISEIVFTEADKLAELNAIVHGAVRRDLARWHDSRHEGILFVETAILYQSGLDAMVDEVWEVAAPLELRIERVMRRNSLTRAQVEARIASQDTFVPAALHPLIHLLPNDGVAPLLPRIESLLNNNGLANF